MRLGGEDARSADRAPAAPLPSHRRSPPPAPQQLHHWLIVGWRVMVHALWQVSMQPRTAEIEFTDESIQRCLDLCDAFLTLRDLPQVSIPDDPCGLLGYSEFYCPVPEFPFLEDSYCLDVG